MSHAKQLHHPDYSTDDLEIINRKGPTGNVKSDPCLQMRALADLDITLTVYWTDICVLFVPFR